MKQITRHPLLTAKLAHAKAVDRVEVKRLEFEPGQKTGLHLHPCPVVGLVTKGTILFQAEGEAPQTLHAGDAFYEPANKKMLHFDTTDAPATFVAFYLLGAEDRELISYL